MILGIQHKGGEDGQNKPTNPRAQNPPGDTQRWGPDQTWDKSQCGPRAGRGKSVRGRTEQTHQPKGTEPTRGHPEMGTQPDMGQEPMWPKGREGKVRQRTDRTNPPIQGHRTHQGTPRDEDPTRHGTRANVAQGKGGESPSHSPNTF